MDHHKNSNIIFVFLVLWIFVISCNNSGHPVDKDIVSNPDKMDNKASESIKKALEFALQNGGKIDDSIRLQLSSFVNAFYSNHDNATIWSHKTKWEPLADSLYQFIQHGELYGLFPDDYHSAQLTAIKNKLDGDSLKRMDAGLWTRADLMLTDGFLHIIKDLKQGRLLSDSLSRTKDSVLTPDFFTGLLDQLLKNKQLTATVNTVEPKYKAYWELKNGIPSFLDSMDRHMYTYVTYPYKTKDPKTVKDSLALIKDSLAFIKVFQKRLNESDCIGFVNKLPDTAQLKAAVKKYQQQKKVKADGIISTSLIKMMNDNDVERFKRIAITLDKYKLLPDSLPKKYIWVNLPSYYLRVFDHDTVALESKVICGKSSTPTPLLNSYITDMVTYPTWTVPTSIIAKQYLPKLKNNPNYLAKLGLRLVNNKGETVDAGNVSWGKYTKGIPFKVMQSSGDNNALGVMKFNFDNPYFVYLHDTNQRYLFKNSSRALSHGCVRVQEWQKLAFYLARNDSLNLRPGDSLRYNTDSIVSWLAAKVRKRIDVKDRVALYIKYFSCEGKDGKIKFYDDIYGEDKVMREKYFQSK